MLLEKIDLDLREAMKQKDALKVSTLRFLKSAINYSCIQKRKESLQEDEVFDVINKQIKMRQDAIEGFRKGNRDDLIQKETREMDILKQYLPEPLSPEELRKIVDEEIGILDVKDKSGFGKVMQAVLSRVKGKADASVVSQIVKEKLNK
ncbi:MAG: GatB/YqeY domain-containing protein [Candidatus Omnitrophica bacterium]|nr:GatB/YqeY domain-containing protein [Candidatus Omnitrophota bacterium]